MNKRYMTNGSKLEIGVIFTMKKNMMALIFCSRRTVSVKIDLDAEYVSAKKIVLSSQRTNIWNSLESHSPALTTSSLRSKNTKKSFALRTRLSKAKMSTIAREST